MTTSSKLQQYIDDFKILTTKQEKHEHLIDIAQTLPALPEQYKTPEHKVPGCISNVYIYITIQNNIITIQASSDALLIRGFVAILVDVLNNQPKETINTIPDDIAQQLGLSETITPSRMNATYAIIQHIKKHL